MPREPLKRTVGKFATSVALAGLVFGGKGDHKVRETPRALEKTRIEAKVEHTNPRKMLDNPEFRKELKALNDESTRMLRRFELKEMTPKDVKSLMSQIEEDFNYLKIEEPQYLKAGLFTPEEILDDFKALGKRIIDLMESTGKRFWNSPDSTILAEIIVLATYIHLARNIRRRGYRYWDGLKDTDPAAFSNYTDVSKSQAPELTFMFFFAANYPHIAIPVFFLNPTIRYYLAKGLDKIRNIRRR